MNAHEKLDYAVVVGIDKYCGLPQLLGAENDAWAFAEWFLRCSGDNRMGPGVDWTTARYTSLRSVCEHYGCNEGEREQLAGELRIGLDDTVDVLEVRRLARQFKVGVWNSGIGADSESCASDRLRLIVTSDFPIPRTPEDLEPTQSSVEKAFRWITSLDRDEHGRVGRRLYIFVAGHGFAQDYEAASLLTAEATEDTRGFFIPAHEYARYFVSGGWFDEVVLFADCCRPERTAVGFREVPLSPPSGDYVRGRPVFFFGTEWKHNTRERRFDDLERHMGVFSRAVVDGLCGAAVRNGVVTVGSLSRYLRIAAPTLAGVNAPIHVIDIDFPSKGELTLVEDCEQRLIEISVHNDGWPRLEVFDSEGRRIEPSSDEWSGSGWSGALQPGSYLIQESDRDCEKRALSVVVGGKRSWHFSEVS